MVVKLYVLLKKKDGITDDYFCDYYENVHGKMFLEEVPEIKDYLVKYEQVRSQSILRLRLSSFVHMCLLDQSFTLQETQAG
jgi:hypothetical protein